MIALDRTEKLASLKSALQRVHSAIYAIKAKRRERDAKGFLVTPNFGVMRLKRLILERCQLQALIARF